MGWGGRNSLLTYTAALERLLLLFQEPDFCFLAQTHRSFFCSNEDKRQ